jgi:hypothetical protein
MCSCKSQAYDSSWRAAEQRQLARKVLIVDEAGMVSSRQMFELVQRDKVLARKKSGETSAGPRRRSRPQPAQGSDNPS